MLFVASGNSINIDAIGRFIAESFSSIRERIPDVELVLAGNVCNGVKDGAASSSWGRSMTLPRFMNHLRSGEPCPFRDWFLSIKKSGGLLIRSRW